jgi:transcription elongation GreA/GreB family factor
MSFVAMKDDHVRHDLRDDEPPGDEAAKVGSRVCVRDTSGEEDYTIVSRTEAAPRQGRISSESPVGRALLGRRRGDEVRVQTPDGLRVLIVVDVASPRDQWSEK